MKNLRKIYLGALRAAARAIAAIAAGVALSAYGAARGNADAPKIRKCLLKAARNETIHNYAI